jgi:hypothetical protein
MLYNGYYIYYKKKCDGSHLTSNKLNMSELTKMIKVPLWELKEIADTLRMVANALDSPKRESCLDRNVMRSWNYVVDMIKGKIPSAPESIDYYIKVGQVPNINE